MICGSSAILAQKNNTSDSETAVVCSGAINNIALVLTPRQFIFWTKLISFLQ